MPTRTEILDALAASQGQVMAFFQGLSLEDLERPATANDVPGEAPWRARDHLAHLAQNEQNIQHLLRRALAGDGRDDLLRMQYPPEVPLPATLGDLEALTAEELKPLVLAVARINQIYLTAHYDDTLEMLVADYLAARQETLELLRQFTDVQLDAPVPTVGGEQAAGDLFVWNAEHASDHLTEIENGLRRGG